MDLLHGAFSAPAFNVAQWANDALQSVGGVAAASPASSPASASASTAADAMNAHLSTTIVRLQLLSQECSDRADTHMSRILSAMPRARRELIMIDSESRGY